MDVHGQRLWDLGKGLDFTLVGPRDLVFGLMRMYGVYREQDRHEEMVFRTEEEAMRWLKGS